jgi:hypothetical protein
MRIPVTPKHAHDGVAGSQAPKPEHAGGLPADPLGLDPYSPIFVARPPADGPLPQEVSSPELEQTMQTDLTPGASRQRPVLGDLTRARRGAPRRTLSHTVGDRLLHAACKDGGRGGARMAGREEGHGS